MLVLDTNVLSEMMQADPAPAVIRWLDRQPAESIWITAVTVFEIRYGLEILPNGKKRQKLENLFVRALQEGLENRVLSFDAVAAQYAASLAAARLKAGRTVDLRDTLIAGIVLARRAKIVTRNTRHFDDLGVAVINPWKSES